MTEATTRRITKFTRRWLRRAALSAAVSALLVAGHAAAATAQDRFLQARDAYKAGERVRLGKLAETLTDHELQPWVEYWRLRLRLDDGSTAGVAEFLDAAKGSYLAEKLRGDWLRVLGKRGEFGAFERELPPLVTVDTDIRCYALQARLARTEGAERDAVAGEVRPLWFSASELPEACTPLLDALVASGRLDVDDVWERVRRLLEGKKLREARAAARYLPAAQTPDAKTLDAIADKPALYLARQRGHLSTRLEREMALFAVHRMARQDPVPAATQWQAIESRFSEADRGYAWSQLAQQAAMRHLPEAVAWFERAGATPLSEDQLAWKTRAALRAGDWARVRQAIEQMPPQLAADPAWTYWQARAILAQGGQGNREAAQALLQKIAGQPSFYGNLADEELGRPISLPPRAAPPSQEELAAAAARPGLRRALALIHLDMRVEGVREWLWSLRGLDDRQLLAAAELARRSEVWDRAISTADRTSSQHDFSLRYLAPFRERIEPKARELDLDHGWVYGLMRQESRFIQRAKSTVGAQGLMQVMPATASWVAKKIGLADYHPARVADMDINVTLGTHYLKMVLASLDNHPVLASAAYNAGPGRARRWRADRPLEGAIYAETIPFSETRDYVKKVMSNAVYYATLFENRPQSLKKRLGTILPAKTGDMRVDELP